MEKYRKTVYCDWGFLESLVSKQDERSRLDNSLNIDDEMIMHIWDLILGSDVKLYLNVSQQDFYAHLVSIEKKCKDRENTLTDFEQIIRDIDLKQRVNKLHLHFNESKIQFNNSLLQDKYLNALFFSSEPETVCTEAMDEFGIIVICPENIGNFKPLIFDQGVALRKSESNNWKQCLFESYNNIIPCNSLVLVDNYILNETTSIEENLTPLFDAIIPLRLNKELTFQVTIFATLNNDRGNNPYPSKKRLELIKNILNKLRPEIKFSVSIVKCSKDKFHDRTIASSNYYISCGCGFDLFKNGKSQKTTTVCAFHPFFNTHTRWSRKAYSDFLLDASRVFQSSTAFNEEKMTDYFPSFTIGDKQNRLLQ